MRDIALTAVFLILLPMVFVQPVVGAYLWAWFSLMNPHQMVWGFAYGRPFALAIAVVTLLALALTRKRQTLPINAVTMLWLALVLWMCITSLFALNDPSTVFERWVFVMKIHLMLLVSLMLVVDARQFRLLVVVVTLSIAFFGIKGGVFTLVTGGGFRVKGPPGGMLSGNNEAAIGIIMVLPYLYWMRQVVSRKWLRLALTISMVLSIFSILGTQSRGALVAVVAIAFFLALKSVHPVRMSVLMAALLALAILFMPDSWTARMDTIESFDQDTSAMSRLWTWQTMWNVAVDRPLVGAGFRADALPIFDVYAPKDGQWAAFAQSGKVWVAHSIYFQLLGEQGFVGALLFLALWTAVWVQAGRLAKRASMLPDLANWLPLLMRMTQVSLVGYASGGAFLSLGYLDLPYYFMGYVILATILVKKAEVQTAPVSARTAAARQAAQVRAQQGSAGMRR
jgi:putative inorganic carbon (HCO3(-)) transporter